MAPRKVSQNIVGNELELKEPFLSFSLPAKNGIGPKHPRTND